MDLKPNQIQDKPKKVGTLNGKPVFQILTKGGFFVIVTAKGTSIETLGTGPHRAVARHIAMKHEPEIVWSELNKSDHVNIEAFSLILPEYEVLTKELRARVQAIADAPVKPDGA